MCQGGSVAYRWRSDLFNAVAYLQSLCYFRRSGIFAFQKKRTGFLILIICGGEKYDSEKNYQTKRYDILFVM